MDKLLLKDSLKHIIKIRLVSIDNEVFRLHYRATTLLFIAFSILVTGTQFFGEPIRCIQSDDIPEKVINTYCWIESTFSLPKALTKELGEDIVYPGVEQYKAGDEVIEHAYYQWVCFVLFLQGMMFYIPRVLWKSLEGGKVSSLLNDLNNPVLCKDDRESKCKALIAYFRKNLYHHNYYALKYASCEVLNFINVVGQIFLVDRFLGGEFTSYGPKVLEFTEMNQINRTDPMIRVFPRMAKCTFHKFGSSGTVQTHDALCLLPLNIVNEKIYVFLWFWMVILAILSGISVAYRILALGLIPVRCVLMQKRNSIAAEEDVEVVTKNIEFGDWFILYLLSKNMHSIHFRDLMAMIAQKIRKDLSSSEGQPTSADPKGEVDSTSHEGDDSTEPFLTRKKGKHKEPILILS